MREIKFRAWDKDKNKMWDINLFLESFEHYKNMPIMQFTGLKDKNGKDIYEGDIIFSGLTTGIMEYDDDSYSFQCGLSSLVLDQECSVPNELLEVIGNIYENPEKTKKRPFLSMKLGGLN